jgi:hypothetical protein
MPEKPAVPITAERAAALVAGLLKVWPSPETSAALQIAFCEETGRVIEPFLTKTSPYVKWFGRIDDQLQQTLRTLRDLVSTAEREAKSVRDQLTKLMRQAPPELRTAIRQEQRRR